MLQEMCKNTPQPRSIEKLLTLLRDMVNTDDGFDGMCISIARMYRNIKYRNYAINIKERYILRDYLEDNTPEEVRLNMMSYWWPCGDTKPRIEWLTEHIKLNTKK